MNENTKSRLMMILLRIVVYAMGGYWHNSAAAVKDLPEPYDENIVYNFHCYEPHIFTHQGAYWMPTMDTAFRIPVTATFGEMATATRRMLGGRRGGS